MTFAQMLAVRVHEYGGPERLTLEDIPVPEPTSKQALVRVAAAGVGPWDALVRAGTSGVAQTLPLTLGSDIAGVIERLDDTTAGIHAGDSVYGLTNQSFTGGYAQYALASTGSIARKPKRLSFIEAASAPVVAVTAWQMLFDCASLSRGQKVLVLGSHGNVGAYAVQLAQWANARVIPISSRDRFENHVHDVDIVVDTVGGQTQQRAFATLKRDGILVSSVSQPPNDLAQRYGVRTAFFIVDVTTEKLERIAQLFDDGVLAPHVGVVLPLAEARTAHEMLAGTVPHSSGKIVLDVSRTPEA
jgi:NADPH:quinone reductase-like Zn-dependent oxidoreductase